MNFLKNALKQITGTLQVGNFGAISFGGDKGVSATASGRATLGGAPPMTGPETSLLLFGAVALVAVFLVARKL
jgi:hypothetical protein